MSNEMTYEELRCALEVATENRRILAQAVLNQDAMIAGAVSYEDWQAEYRRMLSLAQELVK